MEPLLHSQESLAWSKLESDWMRKKILFIMPSMFIGGAERSLLGLLETWDTSRYDVELFLYRHEGEFLKHIPQHIYVLPPVPAYATFDVPIKSLLFSEQFLFGLSRIIGKIALRLNEKLNRHSYGIWASMQYTSRSLQWLLPKISGTYDAAILFLGIPDVLLNKVDADVKIAWNHTDYTILGPDLAYDRKLYTQLDAVASVSEPCTEQFLKIYPDLKEKTVTIQNIISKELLLLQSHAPAEDMKSLQGEKTLLSVGRFCHAKNFDNVPDICRRLREKGHNVKWYLIGFGGDEDLIRQKILEAGMEDYVIILGKKENPYPYIAACDLYVQPSRYEGKCVSVIEAQILHKPVVITNYATSGSQLRDGFDGIIVPMDNAGCAEGIAAVLENQQLQTMLSENTKENDYTNSGEIEKLYWLLEH